jgi:hypothetical protein
MEHCLTRVRDGGSRGGSEEGSRHRFDSYEGLDDRSNHRQEPNLRAEPVSRTLARICVPNPRYDVSVRATVAMTASHWSDAARVLVKYTVISIGE